MKTPFEPLAIVGIGCLFPKADGPGAFWANVKHGVDGIGPVPPTHWNPDDYFDADPKSPDMTYARRGGFLSAVDFNPLEFGIAPRDIEATDTSQLLGLVAAKQALTDAGISFTGAKAVDRDRVSVILGVTGTLELVVPLGARLGHPRWKKAMADAGVPAEQAADAAARIADSYVPWQENSFPGLLGNVVAGRIANKLDLGGTNCVVDAACASSLSAVHLASLELQAGRADVVVTGGVDTFNDIFMFMCFSKTPALSPTGDAKPFDAAGDGTILGEGLGMVVLKRLADAERDGDRIYAVLKGIGSSSDGKGNAIYAPSAAGQRKALKTAYELAGVSPTTIELVEAHGTGTKVGDTVEATALADVYGTPEAGRAVPWCAVGSVKSQIGHTKAAAGAASLIKAALSLYNKVLPPTLKVTQPVEPFRIAESPFYVNGAMRPWLPRAEHPRRAALSAFGFGGSNFHAVLEEHDAIKKDADWAGTVELVAVSGASAASLATAIESLDGTWTTFARFAASSRASFDVSAPARLVLVAHRETTDLPRVLQNARTKLAAEASTAWHTPDGAFFGVGPASGRLAVLFPGQGSQSVGMLREVACLFPEMLASLAAANAAVVAQQTDESDPLRLSDRIYPPTTYDPDAKARHEVALRATDIAQPALGAVSYGAWQVLSSRFGLTADAFAGHSYGELPALAAAGRITTNDLFALSRLRGRLMAQLRGADGGAMLAVFAPAAQAEAVAATTGVVVANRNAPNQTVLSGTATGIASAEAEFTANGVRTARLAVSAAFHSPLVSDAATPFRAALDGVTFAPGEKPVFANSTASEYPADVNSARDLLGHQLANPVAFVEQIRAMVAIGVRTFVEVGPGTILTRLVESITEDGPAAVVAVALDASSGKRSGMLDLALFLGRLAARGQAVTLAAWEAGSRVRPAPPAKPGLTVPICGANSVLPRPARPPRPTTAGTPMTAPATGPTSPGLTQALQLTQQTLAALQQMQDQTARLHKQFLDAQELAQRTLSGLVAQQQALLFPGGATVAPAYVPPPVPVYAPPPPVAVVRPVTPPSIVVPPPVAVVRAAAPPVAPPPAPKPAPVNGSARTSAGIDRLLLEVVAEKTGYPADMLTLDMALDADLGVDSIKRVEILSALQEKLPHAPVVKPEHLGTLHTLRDVAHFLSGGPATTPTAPLNEFEPPVTVALGSIEFPFPVESGTLGFTSPKQIQHLLLGVVAEKTGYPAEMLTLDMALDADLGVDSIKRVEILSALQEKLPLAPVVKPEHLGTLHTLRDVADFLSAPLAGAPRTAKVDVTAIRLEDPGAPTTQKVPVATAKKKADSESALAELLAPKTEQVTKILPQIASDSALLMAPPIPSARPMPAAEPTLPVPAETFRQPVAPINMDRIDRSILQAVDLEATSNRPRLPLSEGAEIWIVAAPDDRLAKETAGFLAAGGFRPILFPWADPDALKPTGNPAGLVLIAPARSPATTPLNKLGYRWLHHAGPLLRIAARQSGATLFATVARFDGAFGLGDLAPTVDPTAGGLAGLVKTARYEWPELSYKAIDLAAPFATEAPSLAATALAEELLLAGPLEVGISAHSRCTLELARTVRRQISGGAPLGPKDVVVVTGGARGVTAEVAVALAEVYQPTLILTGRTPMPVGGPEPEWLRGLTDEAEMKKAIADHLGSTASPKQVGEMFAKSIAQREVSKTLSRIEAAGAKAAYFAVNVANGRQVADLLHQVQVKFGPVTALVHGAGVLADRKIEDLTSEQFDSVYNTKVDGLKNLLDLLGGSPLKALMLFSSTTARFGRTGQLAYAVANEVLNKTAQVEARKRPTARVVAINWGPWEGGMVTPSLRRVFEGEGVGLIPLAEGGLFAVQELTAAGKAVEVIALGKAGRPGKNTPATGTADGRPSAAGSSGAGLLAQTGPPATNPPPPELALAFERVVEIGTHPVLRSHVLDGRAVLPMALHMEWLAHAALHGNPGLVFHGFNDLRITHGIMVEDGTSTTLRALAGKAVKQEKFFLVPVELRGKRRDGRDAVHSRAEVLLTAALPKPPMADPVPDVQPYPHPVEEVYKYFLFHGPDLQGIERVDGISEMAFLGTAYPAPSPSEWFEHPLRSAWVTDPLVIDTSFQMMILWSFAQHGAGSLPCFAGRYRQYRRAFPAGPAIVAVRVTRDNGSFARADIDYLDTDGQIIAQVQDYECVIDRQLDQAFRKNQLAPKVKV